MLLAGVDLGVDAGALERFGQLRGDTGQELALVAAGALERFLEHAVALRIERPEAEVLEFELHGVEAEALGERRVDIEGLTRDRAAADRAHALDGPHVVQPVGELHEDHAQIAHHREQHLAERLRLRFLAALELDLVELGDAVDELGDRRAEACCELFFGDRRVFYDVMQDRCDDGVGIDAQLREDVGGGDRMGDVGLASLAFLATVRLGTELRRLADALDLVGGQVGAGGAQEVLETRGPAGAGQQPEQPVGVIHGVPLRGGGRISLRGRTAAHGSPGRVP